MRIKLKFKTFIFVSTLFVSCESSKIKNEAEKKAIEFFVLLKEGNENKLFTQYPSFEKLETYYKSDSAKINYITEHNNIITVSIHNRFTNGYGKVIERNISLFFTKDSTGQLNLFDSKGLSDFSEKDEYIFGINTGCIDKATDTTDQQIIQAIEKAKLVMHEKAIEVYMELKKDIKVVDWNWETGYGKSASGRGIVKNNSSFSIPSLKYKIVYKNRQGDEITSDDGYVDYDVVNAGESKSFTFFTSYVGNATIASLELKFDDELIYKYLANKNWTKNECEEYFKNNPEKLNEL